MVETFLELPHHLYVSADLLGMAFPWQVGELDVTLLFPRLVANGNTTSARELDPPAFRSIDDTYDWERVLKSPVWGMTGIPTKGVVDQVRVTRIGVRFEGSGAHTRVGAIQEAHIHELTTAWEGACDWLEVLTGQVHGPPPEPVVLGATHPLWERTPERESRCHPIPLSGTLMIGGRRVPSDQYVIAQSQVAKALALVATGKPPVKSLVVV